MYIFGCTHRFHLFNNIKSCRLPDRGNVFKIGILDVSAEQNFAQPAFLLNFHTAQRYDAFSIRYRHVLHLKSTSVIFPSRELFFLQSFEVTTIDIYVFPRSYLAVSIIGMSSGEMENEKKTKKLVQ